MLFAADRTQILPISDDFPVRLTVKPSSDTFGSHEKSRLFLLCPLLHPAEWLCHHAINLRIGGLFSGLAVLHCWRHHCNQFHPFAAAGLRSACSLWATLFAAGLCIPDQRIGVRWLVDFLQELIRSNIDDTRKGL